jgi:archaellum component FlaC
MSEGNGHNTVTERMVEVLERIEGELKGTNARLDGIQTELRDFKQEVREGFAEVLASAKSIDNNLSSVRREAIEDGKKLELRVEKLEAAVFKPPTPPARRRRATRAR